MRPDILISVTPADDPLSAFALWSRTATRLRSKRCEHTRAYPAAAATEPAWHPELAHKRRLPGYAVVASSRAFSGSHLCTLACPE